MTAIPANLPPELVSAFDDVERHGSLDVVSLVTAAQLLAVSYWVCRDLLTKGTLKGYKRGRHWYVTRESIEAYIREQTEAA